MEVKNKRRQTLCEVDKKPAWSGELRGKKA